jgi:hypothetical protein
MTTTSLPKCCNHGHGKIYLYQTQNRNYFAVVVCCLILIQCWLHTFKFFLLSLKFHNMNYFTKKEGGRGIRSSFLNQTHYCRITVFWILNFETINICNHMNIMDQLHHDEQLVKASTRLHRTGKAMSPTVGELQSGNRE